jgi:hypothetical protein
MAVHQTEEHSGAGRFANRGGYSGDRGLVMILDIHISIVGEV